MRYSLINFLGRHPLLLRAYCRVHPRLSNLIVRPDSELVIEGFPRSANTFAVLAFEKAQPGPVRIAHHLHAIAQITLGIEFHIPVLVLIREPVGAVVSLIGRDWRISPAHALTEYIHFYKRVQANIDKVVLADFKSITGDYAKIIEAVNVRFGASFLPYINTPANDKTVFEAIDRLNLENEGGEIYQLARPFKGKNDLHRSARRRVETHPLLDTAMDCFATMRTHCA